MRGKTRPASQAQGRGKAASSKILLESSSQGSKQQPRQQRQGKQNLFCLASLFVVCQQAASKQPAKQQARQRQPSDKQGSQPSKQQGRGSKPAAEAARQPSDKQGSQAASRQASREASQQASRQASRRKRMQAHTSRTGVPALCPHVKGIFLIARARRGRKCWLKTEKANRAKIVGGIFGSGKP